MYRLWKSRIYVYSKSVVQFSQRMVKNVANDVQIYHKNNKEVAL